MLIDFFASLSFYIIPYLTGRFFTKKVFLAWIVGAFLWFAIYFSVFTGLQILKINNFSLVIRYLAIGISLFSLINIGYSFRKERPRFDFLNLQIGTFLLVFTSIVYFLIWKRNTPYPLQLNWDIYEHITLANLISDGKLSFFTTRISDTFTFTSYSPLFGILLSLPKIIFQRGLLGIYWWLEYWHYFLTAIASFLIAQKLFRDRGLALLAAILSSLTFEAVIAYSALFLIPQTMVALITVFLASEIISYKKIFLLIASLVILLMHYVVGPLCLAFLGVLYLAPRLPISLKFLNAMVVLATAFLLGILGLHFLGNWQVLSIEEASHFSFSIFEKAGFILDWYGIFILFALIGFFGILRGKNYSQKIILILALIIFGISFSPFSYFLKFYVLGHYLTNLIIVAGIAVLVSNFSNFLKFISFTILTVSLAITFYNNQLLYKEPLHFGNYVAQISNGEVDASAFLASYNKKENAFLVSDPSLQYVLEANSGVNTQGGVYMNLSTRKTLESMNGSYNPVFIRNKVLSIEDSLTSDRNSHRQVLFAVGGRYFEWQALPRSQKESTFYNIWSPKTITPNDQTYINFLKNSKQFKLLYQNKEIAIFQVI